MGVFATRMRVFRPSLCLTGLRSLPGRRLTTSSLGDAEMEVDMERTSEALDLSSTSLKDMRVEPIVQEQDDGGPVILGVKVSPKEKKETDSIGESWMRDRLKLEQTLQEESNAQVNDPQVIFDAVYADLCRKYNEDRDLVFPKEVIWLCGAPGSGKGTHAAQIMKQRGITAAPIVMSDLLISSESKKAKEEGRLVADGYVLERLLHEMIDPKFKQGVIVDGFPRNSFQTEFVRLLHQKMLQLREQHGRPFRRPAFRLAVLWVPESVSVHRQLQRGMEAKRENEERVRQGLEPLQDVERATDFDESKAQERYRTFRNNYEVILELQRSFHFTVVDATPSRQEVAKALEKEFQYQSSLELDVDTYGMIDHIPTVAGISMHARQLLVKRLDAYAARQKPLLQRPGGHPRQPSRSGATAHSGGHDPGRALRPRLPLLRGAHHQVPCQAHQSGDGRNPLGGVHHPSLLHRVSQVHHSGQQSHRCPVSP